MKALTRRTFILGGVALAGGLAVGYYIYARPFANPLPDWISRGESALTPYLVVSHQGDITVIVPRAEMGQGVSTSLAQLVAEELDVDFAGINVVHGPVSPAYYNRKMISEHTSFAHFDESFLAEATRDFQGITAKFLAQQATGGSTSVTDAFDKMRQAGAAARHVLVAAAARRLEVEPAGLQTRAGQVIDPASGRAIGYGELAAQAANMALPEQPPLKTRRQWNIIGKPVKRTDVPAKVSGQAKFGIDVDLPDMLFATVRMNPRLGGAMRSFDAAPASSMPGVVKIVDIGNGIGVIADNTWRAFEAAKAVEIEWNIAAYPPTTKAIFAQIGQALDDNQGTAFRDDGDAERALAGAREVVEARYSVPFLAHACMEPMNATARFAQGKLELWTGTQAPTLVQLMAAIALDLDSADVTVHVQQLGGGFGRRLETDYAIYAARLAAEVPGRPVKVTWTREEDISHDFYRPAAMARFRGAIAADRLPVVIDAQIASPSIQRGLIKRWFPSVPDVAPADKMLAEGAFDQPYAITDYRVSGIEVDLDIPIGFWRSVGNSMNAFFHECFLDELAHQGGIDPVEMRLELMKPWPVAAGVVEAAADMAGWGRTLPTGRGLGIAHTLSFGTYVAVVAEVFNDADGLVIEQAWCAADVGTAVNPAILAQQLEGAVLFGFSAAVFQKITFAGGEVEQSNFHDHDGLRIHQTPPVEVKILEHNTRMGGGGEPGTPPAAPALANAVFAATGKRIRDLPLSDHMAFKT